MIVAYTNRDLMALGFLAAVLMLVLWALIGGLRRGVIYIPGKRRMFRVVRAKAPFSYWGGVVFYCLFVVILPMMAWGVLRQMIWPGPSEPTSISVVALDHATVDISWLSPDRRDPPEDYGIYRSTEPGGTSLNDYTLIATFPRPPYQDRAVKPATRYYYRVAANYPGQPPAMSGEDSSVTDAAP